MLEECSARFKDAISLKEHQNSHIHISDIFYIKTQAFNNSTLVYRKDLIGQSLENFDFVTSEDCVIEVRRILRSEVVKKHSLIFTIAVTINFIKFDIDGEIKAKCSPCFLSESNYLNNVSEFNVYDLIQSSIFQIQRRYDDFVEKGSGWTIEGMKFFDLHITQTFDIRGGCGSSLFSIDLKEIVSRRAGLLVINNNDSKCLLYCIAAAFTYNPTGISSLEKSNPNRYLDFVNQIKVSNIDYSVKFPVSLNKITELERLNRDKTDYLPFRINVFREDMLTQKLFLIRSSPYKDGKIINVLLTEFTVASIEYCHYVLVENTSFLKKDTTVPVKIVKNIMPMFYSAKIVLNIFEVKVH